MAGDVSAYAALGLAPGADSSAIEQAYRKLIKEHHPDRRSGDSRRAAEIIEAYRELRAERNLKDPLELNDELAMPERSGLRWVAAALLLIAGIGALLLLTGPLSSIAQPEGRHSKGLHRIAGAVAVDPMDQPLHQAAIDTGSTSGSASGPHEGRNGAGEHQPRLPSFAAECAERAAARPLRRVRRRRGPA